MEDIEVKRMLDYSEGDIVQIINCNSFNGRCGEIVGIRLAYDGTRFVYNVRLSDKILLVLLSYQMQLVRHADEPQPEE